MASDHDRPLGALLRDSIDDARLERIRRGVALRRSAPARAVPRPAAIAALAGGVALVVVGVLVLPRAAAPPAEPPAPGPLRVAGPGALEPFAAEEADASPRTVRLDDGSRIHLEPGAAVTTRRNTGSRLALVLDRGRARFEVEPEGPRLWTVDAGLAEVEVVGTAFTVARADASVSVSAERGVVLVRSGLLQGGARELRAGERLEVRRPEPAAPEPASAEPSEETLETADEGPRDGGSSARLGPRWRALARVGDHRAAYDSLGAEGLRHELARVSSMDDLLLLADVARRSGHAAEAVPALERALAEHPEDRRAAVAAFTLGRVESDALGRHDRAARAFARCLELGPPRALDEDARARLAEAYGRAGSYDDARAAARQYLERYPEGRRAVELRRWVDRL